MTNWMKEQPIPNRSVVRSSWILKASAKWGMAIIEEESVNTVGRKLSCRSLQFLTVAW